MMKKLLRKLDAIWVRIRYPENICWGGSLKRETSLRSVGYGWSKFINNLYDAKPKRTKVWQVKEKYAGLRFYISSAPEWYFDLIDYYEDESYKTCEVCGEKGKVRDDLGWILTLCDKHYEEKLNKNKK